jgi:hypothetical protein
MQHKGDLIVNDQRETTGQITGTTYVKAGGLLIAHGQLAGGLIIEEGGKAVVHGQVCRNILNHGTVELLGQVSGKVIGNAPVNQVKPGQIVGTDLQVPFRGRTISWSST